MEPVSGPSCGSCFHPGRKCPEVVHSDPEPNFTVPGPSSMTYFQLKDPSHRRPASSCVRGNSLLASVPVLPIPAVLSLLCRPALDSLLCSDSP